MRVLMIHRYFWPDSAPYGHMLRYIASALSAEHEVTVLTAQPSYKPEWRLPSRARMERMGGVTVRRVSLLPARSRSSLLTAVNAVLFTVQALLHAWRVRRRFDVIMVSTSPPIVLGLVVRIAAAASGSSYVYHCQDLHPEVGLYAGLLSPGRWFRTLQRIDADICRKAARVIVVSPDMRTTLLERDAALGSRVRVIDNFALPNDPEAADLPPALAKPAGRFRVLFAGNIGRFQSLETLIDVATALPRGSDVEFVFLGDGAAKRELQERAAGAPRGIVRFFDHVSVDLAARVMQTADLCVVSLAPDIHKVAFPSKTMNCLSAGQPLLVLAEPHSELARLVERESVGFVIDRDRPGDVAALITRLAQDPSELQGMRSRAAELGRKRFSMDVILPQWEALFRELAATRHAAR
jgi:glycosyltransferase involved in cell wall biosynthesis